MQSTSKVSTQPSLLFQQPSAPPPYDDSSQKKSFLSDALKHVPKELQDDYKALNIEIERNGMSQHEARVCLVLDISASMQNPNQFFGHPQKGNQVQKLINKALTLAFLFDDNKKIEIIPFGDKAYPIVEVDQKNFSQATDLVLNAVGGTLKESTNYAAPMVAMRTHYFKNADKLTASQTCHDAPVFVIFITDGEPNASKLEAMNQFKSASHQAVFIKFIALRGAQEDQKFTYLQNIDDIKANDDQDDHRFYVDNSDLVVLDYPEELTMSKLLHEYRPWLAGAREKKLLSHSAGMNLSAIDKKADGRVVALADNKVAMFGSVQHSQQKQQPPAPNGVSSESACCVIM